MGRARPRLTARPASRSRRRTPQARSRTRARRSAGSAVRDGGRGQARRRKPWSDEAYADAGARPSRRSRARASPCPRRSAPPPARFLAPIFWIAAERWFRTVPSDSPRLVAMSATVPLVAARASASRSARTAGWRPRSARRGRAPGPRPAGRAPPAGSRRRARVAGASLSRNPVAPASIARRRYPGRPNVVRITTRQAGSGGPELRGRGQPVEPGHLDVEQRDVGPGLQRPRHDLVAATDLGDDLEVGSSASRAASAPRTIAWSSARRIRVTRRVPRRARSARETRSRKPPSGRGPASRLPPSVAARSRSPSSPVPCPLAVRGGAEGAPVDPLPVVLDLDGADRGRRR